VLFILLYCIRLPLPAILSTREEISEWKDRRMSATSLNMRRISLPFLPRPTKSSDTTLRSSKSSSSPKGLDQVVQHRKKDSHHSAYSNRHRMSIDSSPLLSTWSQSPRGSPTSTYLGVKSGELLRMQSLRSWQPKEIVEYPSDNYKTSLRAILRSKTERRYKDMGYDNEAVRQPLRRNSINVPPVLRTEC